MSAATKRATAKTIAGTVAIRAAVTKAARKLTVALVSVRAAVSAINPHVQVVMLIATVSTSASVATQVIRGAAKNLHIRFGVPFTNWVTSTIHSIWRT